MAAWKLNPVRLILLALSLVVVCVALFGCVPLAADPIASECHLMVRATARPGVRLLNLIDDQLTYEQCIEARRRQVATPLDRRWRHGLPAPCIQRD